MNHLTYMAHPLIGVVGITLLGIVLYSLSYLISKSDLLQYHPGTYDKISPYECGFLPFGDSREKFNVSFFIVGILLILFDLEVSYLLPWSVLHIEGIVSIY
eukprot:Pompholyxophrys_sp_v1_NODE_42_length_3229_cov_18.434783.p1 type:complete len:101 gc:universal NODE_42_length_3229_cov_18.434783:1552-1854(+)